MGLAESKNAKAFALSLTSFTTFAPTTAKRALRLASKSKPMNTPKTPPRPLSTPLWRESIQDNRQRRQDRAERIQRGMCLYILLPVFVTVALWFIVKTLAL